MKRLTAIIFFFYSCAIAWAQFTFQPSKYAVQNAALVTVSVDFNGDGKLDLAVANAGASTVSVFLGNGAGAFGTPTVVTIPGGCFNDSLKAGDFNNDGKMDLLVVCGLQTNVWFLPGLGTGQFGTPVLTILPQQTIEIWIQENIFQNVAVADFNGDGVLDLVLEAGPIENATPSQGVELDLMLGNGDGTFGKPSPILQGYYGGWVLTADFNGDGKADLAVEVDTSTTYALTIYRGNGDGTFQAASSIPTTGAAAVGSVAVADVNRDGIPDLIVAGGNGTSSGTSLIVSTALQVFLGNGDGTFKSGFGASESGVTTPGVILADFHGTGIMDLVEEHVLPDRKELAMTDLSMTLRVGNGDGTFQNPVQLVLPSGLSPWWFAMTVGDWNGDGLADLAFTASPSSAALSGANIGGSTLQAIIGSYQQMPPATLVVMLNGLPHAPFADGGQALAASGGSSSLNLVFPADFAWTATSSASWLTISGAASGSGGGVLNFQAAQNTGADRSATLDVGGYTFTIEQAGAVSGLNFIGSMPHLAAEENWTTAFTLVNKSAGSSVARLSLFGDPSGALTLPLDFPEVVLEPLPLLGASFDRTLAANASLVVDTAGPQNPPVQEGSAQLAATGAVDGFAIFHLIPGAQEAVVPMETRNASSYLLAFDNTGGVVLGIAVTNVSAQAANIGVVIRDDTGAQIGTGSLPVAANGHFAFVLSSTYPATANLRGTIEFDTPAGGKISVLGIRTTPLDSSNTLTTIPALANVGTNGGSIAHIATGNGWQTTFVLVNAGSNAAQANLNFFGDDGSALSLPLSFPQAGGGSSTVASSVNQTLAAGASWIVESAAPLANPAPTIGSAQLTTTGNIGGFVIFRYNPNGQEAVVPLEDRNASAYLLAFDNTAGTATGVAINSVSGQAVNVPVTIRNPAGAQIGTGSIALGANGHSAFVLSTQFPVTANIGGTIEFDAPPGGQIGVLGIRTPVAHTFTTLPALAK